MDDIIDSRDVINRIEELENERDGLVSEVVDREYNEDISYGELADIQGQWATEYPEDAAELEALQSLAEEAEGYTEDWQYGEALIRYSYFTEYCMKMLADIGDLPREIPHYIVIDEDATAENIKMDYTEVDFDGV